MKNKIIGTKFEVWAEQLFSDLGYNVRRNTIYYKGSKKRGNTYRQVDLEYFGKTLGFFPWHTILELKYSNGGKIRLNHRAIHPSKKKQERSIENLVAEVDERRRFVRANSAIIITNSYFTDELKKEAKKCRIKLYDRDKLLSLDKQRASFFEKIGIKKRALLEEQVGKVRLSKQDFRPSYVKLL
mgnify:CR=1 FL=1